MNSTFINHFLDLGWKNPYGETDPVVYTARNGTNDRDGRMRFDETECSSRSSKKQKKSHAQDVYCFSDTTSIRTRLRPSLDGVVFHTTVFTATMFIWLSPIVTSVTKVICILSPCVYCIFVIHASTSLNKSLSSALNLNSKHLRLLLAEPITHLYMNKSSVDTIP